ncbi:MAG: proteasome assembly chaperone family protein [Halobacteriaceae archaeon]
MQAPPTRGQSRPDFDIAFEPDPGGTLLAGISSYGLAGLTAVSYLVDAYELTERGHLSTSGLPSMTPFENGVPRHHTRFFGGDLPMTVLVGELFIPAGVADAFADALFSWLEAHDVDEIALLAGVPVAHGPEEHRAYHVATADYRARRLEGVDVPGMGRGFLDGMRASLVERGLDSPVAVGVFVTPVHPQAPDVDAAIRLLDAVESVYGVEVDVDPLREYAEEVRRYYAELAERVAAVEESQRPEDRMYM